MDMWGIGHSLRSVVRAYFHGARASGRTTSLVNTLKDGDRVVCVNRQQAKFLEERCLERGVMVECVVVDPRNPADGFDRMRGRRKPTRFDHTWVEQFYEAEFARVEGLIDRWQEDLSGPLVETPKQPMGHEEYRKFRFGVPDDDGLTPFL